MVPLLSFNAAFAHFEQNLWRVASHCQYPLRLEIDWNGVTMGHGFVSLRNLLKKVRVPVFLRVTMLDPRWELLDKLNVDWRYDTNHYYRSLLRFFDRNLKFGNVRGELFTYRQEPSIHGFSLDNRYFYLTNTEQCGNQLEIIETDGYQFLMSGHDSEERISLFRSASKRLSEKQVWPPAIDLNSTGERHVEIRGRLADAARRALTGDREDYESYIKTLMVGWIMEQLRNLDPGMPSETKAKQSGDLREEAKKKQLHLMEYPNLILDWIIGEFPGLTATAGQTHVAISSSQLSNGSAPNTTPIALAPIVPLCSPESSDENSPLSARSPGGGNYPIRHLAPSRNN
ncbi:MAG: hypothetical protein EXS16_10500 [Gemmataceae bacterium]|nr:hypothetical protein [Gemmataceae bacterium]